MNTHRQLIKDANGKPIGYYQSTLHRINVQDASGKPLGFVANGKTFDVHGKLISQNEVPGLLLDR